MAISDRDKRTLKIGGIVVGRARGDLPGAQAARRWRRRGGRDELLASAYDEPRQHRWSTGGAQGSESPSLAPSPVLVLPVRDPFAIPAGFPAPSGWHVLRRVELDRYLDDQRRDDHDGDHHDVGTGTGTRTPTQPSSATQDRRRTPGHPDRHVHDQRGRAGDGRGRRHGLSARRPARRSVRTSSTDCNRSRGTAPRSCSGTSRSRSACRRTSSGRHRRRRCAHGGSGRRSSGGGFGRPRHQSTGARGSPALPYDWRACCAS